MCVRCFGLKTRQHKRSLKMYKSITRKELIFNLKKSWIAHRNYQCDGSVYGFRCKPSVQHTIAERVLKNRQTQSNFCRWIDAYRAQAHRKAQVNPVAFKETETHIPELELARYGFEGNEYQIFEGILHNHQESGSIRNAEEFLQKVYCGAISVEFAHIESEAERDWMAENYEKSFSETLSDEAKREIADLLIKCQVWDNFLAKKYPSVKRYGGEGAEAILAFFRQILLSSAEHDLSDVVLGMPHRGKLNFLTTMLNTRPAKIFRKFSGQPEFPSDAKAMGDVASHFNASEDLNVNGKKIHFSMLHNPSHLEAVNPVSMGKARSKQQTARDGAFSDDAQKPFSTSVLNVQLHGDAAFVGQGINQEMLMMAGTPHFDVGGTIHLIVNNQVGFTTPGDRGRATRYCTDLAKSIDAPIFHVNGDDPEALTAVTKLAFNYQRQFRKDVFIDLNCFRRWGHNELDDPTFTNPALYKIIHSRKSVPDLYADKLVQHNICDTASIKRITDQHWDFLNDEFEKLSTYQPEASYFQKQWSHLQQAESAITRWDTGIDYGLLQFIGKQSVYYPSNFAIHPHLLKVHVNSRLKRLEQGDKIDWATAEALAIGSLMYQGHNVRLSGEDVGRGTFSHRHAMLVDQSTNEMYIPMNSLKHGHGGKLEVANSILSEEAVLGFEYGMAIDNPNNLIIWEAQFGDFFNGAQLIIDAFIVTGETKWMTSNGLVMLLPHGYDGAASDHSSCRMERFLQQTDSKEQSPDGDDINVQIINPTTPAQYFHALRRQMVRNFRKPLVVVAPKTLLRLSDAASNHLDFAPGTSFRPVIGDSLADPSRVKRVILCSGKHFYNLNAHRIESKIQDVAIVRVESLCPFPVQEINQELEQYKNAKAFVWSQEEHRNMGAWSFVRPRFENMCGRKISYCGRPEGATTAVGVSSWHKVEATEVITNPFRSA